MKQYKLVEVNGEDIGVSLKSDAVHDSEYIEIRQGDDTLIISPSEAIMLKRAIMVVAGPLVSYS